MSTSTTSPSTTLGIPLLAKDVADRRSDVALREDPGRNLVEQRLKQVVVCAVDNCHFHIGVAQGLGGKEPSESASNDGHSMTPHAGTIALFAACV